MASNSSNFGDVNYGEIAAGQQFRSEAEASGNVQAERAASTALAGADAGTVPTFFAEERRKTQQQMALDDARAQTTQMKQAIKLQNDNFDTAFRNERRLAKMDSAASKALIGEEKRIKLDSFGRKMLSERQLADWYNTRASREEDWANLQQRSAQLHERKLMLLKASYAKIEQAEKQAFAKWGQAVDHELQTDLAMKKRDLADKVKREQERAANRSAMYGALGGILSIGAQYAGAKFAGAGKSPTTTGAESSTSTGAATGSPADAPITSDRVGGATNTGSSGSGTSGVDPGASGILGGMAWRWGSETPSFGSGSGMFK